MDTLQNARIVHDTIFIKGADGIDLLNKVDSFYNSAWAKLLFFWTVIAIIVPTAISWFQKRTLEHNKEKLLEEITAKTIIIQNELKAEIKQEFKDELSKLVSKLELQGKEIDAKAYAVLSNVYFEINQNDFAFVYTVYAMYNFIILKNHIEIKNGLSKLGRILKMGITKKAIKDAYDESPITYEDIITMIKQFDSDYMIIYADRLKEVHLLYEKLPEE